MNIVHTTAYLLILGGLLAAVPPSVYPQSAHPARTVQIRLNGSFRLDVREAGQAGREHLITPSMFAQVQVDVFLSPTLSVSPNLLVGLPQKRDGGTTSLCPFIPPCISYRQTDTFYVLQPGLRVAYHHPVGRRDLYVGGGVHAGLARLARRFETSPMASEEAEPHISRVRFHTINVGLTVVTGFSYDLWRRNGVFGELGYRVSTSGTFDGSHTHSQAGSPSDLAYDISGPFAAVGLVFTL